jgi:hydroxymethylpyrimidine pyrophosphatase-like HAD family hydrolase
MIANASVPIVCEMGVWLYDPRDNSYAMDPGILRSHLEAIAACQAWVRAELSPLGVVMQPGKVASISLWHKDTAKLLSMQEAVRERVSKEGWGLRVSSTVAWINLDLAHVSKGTGIDRLLTQLEREGTPAHREGLFGIGDTMTDMAIRERVAWFGCPQNADARLKERADFVAQSEHARGVVECLEEARWHGGR